MNSLGPPKFAVAPHRCPRPQLAELGTPSDALTKKARGKAPRSRRAEFDSLAEEQKAAFAVLVGADKPARSLIAPPPEGRMDGADALDYVQKLSPAEQDLVWDMPLRASMHERVKLAASPDFVNHCLAVEGWMVSATKELRRGWGRALLLHLGVAGALAGIAGGLANEERGFPLYIAALYVAYAGWAASREVRQLGEQAPLGPEYLARNEASRTLLLVRGVLARLSLWAELSVIIVSSYASLVPFIVSISIFGMIGCFMRFFFLAVMAVDNTQNQSSFAIRASQFTTAGMGIADFVGASLHEDCVVGALRRAMKELPQQSSPLGPVFDNALDQPSMTAIVQLLSLIPQIVCAALVLGLGDVGAVDTAYMVLVLLIMVAYVYVRFMVGVEGAGAELYSCSSASDVEAGVSGVGVGLSGVGVSGVGVSGVGVSGVGVAGHGVAGHEVAGHGAVPAVPAAAVVDVVDHEALPVGIPLHD